MTTSNDLHVIFGTGPVGYWTMIELLRLGKRVRMVNRSGKADVPAGVEVVAADAYDLTSAKAVVQGAAAVYQSAQPHYHEWVEQFPPLQANILEAAASVGAKLIVTDNLYMYGDPQGQTITEQSPCHPHTRKGKVRLAMAEAVMAAHRSGKVRATIGRASDFWGPRDLVQGEQLFYPALNGRKANLIGDIHQPHSFTWVKDFGTALATLGTREEALGQVWIAPTNAPITQADLIKMVEREVGKPVQYQVGGRVILSLIGLFNPGARELVEMLYEFNKPFVVSSQKFEQTFGIQPTPFDQAIKETVAWFKANPAAGS
jgi:nucleoside-diphosphate-sugar epimerase